jgi:hypothetical protein
MQGLLAMRAMALVFKVLHLQKKRRTRTMSTPYNAIGQIPHTRLAAAERFTTNSRRHRVKNSLDLLGHRLPFLGFGIHSPRAGSPVLPATIG